MNKKISTAKQFVSFCKKVVSKLPVNCNHVFKNYRKGSQKYPYTFFDCIKCGGVDSKNIKSWRKLWNVDG